MNNKMIKKYDILSDTQNYILMTANNNKCMNEISKFLNSSIASTYRNTRTLQKKGLIHLEYEEGNNQKKVLNITRKGLEVRRRLWEIHQIMNDENCI
jgi:DNA-binding MarR family transcriptional regulator